MKPKINNLKVWRRRALFLRLYILYFQCLLLVLAFQSCDQPKPADYQILFVDDVINTNNFSGNIKLLGQDQSQIVVWPGDLLVRDEINFFYFPRQQGMHIGIDKGAVSVVAESDSMLLDSAYSDPLLFADHLVQESFNVKSITFIADSLSGEQMQLVNTLSGLYPTAGLSFQSTDNYTKDVLLKFNPRWLILSEMTEDDFWLLENLPETEILYLGISDSIVTKPLPKINRLTTLYLEGIGAASIPTDFLINNPEIETIWIELEHDNYSFLKGLKKLKKLTISARDIELSKPVIFENFKNLTELQICVDSLADTGGLFYLKKLQKLAIGLPLSQKDFDSIIQQNPEISVLGFCNHSGQQSLAEIKNLKNLDALFFTDTIYDRQTVAELSQLKLLGIPESMEKDSAYLELLQKQLPNCQIGINYGFCMGTGWLLAFFPLLVVVVLLGRFNKKQKS